MSNKDSPKDPWKAHTQIDRETFLKHIFKCAEWEKGRLGINVYCVEPSYNVIETGPFIEYVGNKYPQFVFSKTEIEDMLDSGKWPSKEAQKRSDFPDDPSTDGKLGELILFLFVDAVLEIPMVSHKLFWTQEAVQEVKGSDGLFYGMHDGEESLALGESKIQKRRSDALRNSLDSITRFYDPTGDTKTRHELTVAADNLSSNLSEPELDKLRNLLKEGKQTYKQIHPIFAAYDESWMLDIQAEAQDEDELRELVADKIDNSGVKRYLFDKLDEEEYKKLKKYELIFFLLPLEDADSFREQLQHELYPYINS